MGVWGRGNYVTAGIIRWAVLGPGICPDLSAPEIAEVRGMAAGIM